MSNTSEPLAATQCYCKGSSHISSSCGEAQPCSSSEAGRFVTCCGVNAVCGMDGFCFDDHPDTRPVDGYYMGGCTDPTFSDAACPQQCTDDPNPDVVYNAATGLWSCCYGPAGLNCSNPSPESFSDKNPAFLFGTRAARSSVLANQTVISSTATESALSTSTSLSTPSKASLLPATSSSGTAPTTGSAVPNNAVPSVSNQISLGVGLGVGLPSLICAILTSILAVRKCLNRSKSKKVKQPRSPRHQQERRYDRYADNASDLQHKDWFHIERCFRPEVDSRRSEIV